MAKLEAVLFDIDGTLVDTVDLHAEAWRIIFQEYGHDVPAADIRVQIGKGSDQLMPVFLSEEEVDRIGEEMSEKRGKMFKETMMPTVKAFLEVKPLFERVKAAGLKIALASSGSKEEVAFYAKLLGIEDLIETGTSTDDAAKSKPHPDIFEAALKKLGGLPGEAVLAVGDTPYDADAAAKIGIRTLGVLCGGFPEKDLRAAGAVAIFQDPADLLRRFDESPLAQG